MKSPPPDFLSPWYLALESEYGIEISCSDGTSVMAALYKARRLSSDPELKKVQIRRPANERNVLWLIKEMDEKHGKGTDEAPDGSIADLDLGESG